MHHACLPIKLRCPANGDITSDIYSPFPRECFHSRDDSRGITMIPDLSSTRIATIRSVNEGAINREGIARLSNSRKPPRSYWEFKVHGKDSQASKKSVGYRTVPKKRSFSMGD